MTAEGSSPAEPAVEHRAAAPQETSAAAEQAIAQEIEQARAQLAETVAQLAQTAAQLAQTAAQLAARANVTERANQAASRLGDQLKLGTGQVKTQSIQQRQRFSRQWAQGAGAATALVVAAIVVARRKRR